MLGIIFIVFNIFFNSTLIKGDINLDHNLSAYDIVIIKRYLEGYDTNLSFIDLYLMDMNYDFKIRNEDIILLQKKIIK